MDDNRPTIIIDNGSFQCRAGTSCDNAPTSCFQAMVGRPKNPGIMVGMESKEYFVGDEAQAKRGILNLKYSFENGIVNNWDDMERIWHHAFFNELRVAPDEHPTFITDKLNNPIACRENMAKIMFETFQVPSLYIGNQSGLNLQATGRETGVVVDSGHQMTDVVCIIDAYQIKNTYQFSNIGGTECTNWLMKYLGRSFTTTAEREIVRHIKETLTYVAYDYESEIYDFRKSNIKFKEYELPDGNILIIENQRIICPEILFKPHFINSENKGIHELIQQSLDKINDLEIRNRYMQDIVFTGGNSLIPGIHERLKKEISLLANPKINSKPIPPNERYKKYQTWLGAKVQSEINLSKGLMITYQEYKECGGNIVHRKCLGNSYQYYRNYNY